MMKYEFLTVPDCNMCGSNDARMIGMRLNTSQGLRPAKAQGIAVSVMRCGDCGLIYSNPLPIPEKLSDHYDVPPDEYWGEEALRYSEEYFRREISTAKRLLSFTPGMRALDIGVGFGKGMRSLIAAGFDAWGLEPSAPFRDKAIDLMGFAPDRIQLAPIETAEYPAGQFDFVTFGAVLEHIYDPRKAIERAMHWLRPGGILHAEVPLSDHLIPKLVNLFFRLRGTNYVTHISPMHSPFHLYEFTRESFGDFDVAEHWYEVCAIYHVPKILHPPLRWWMRKTNTGMQMTVFLRKPEAA